MMGKVVCSIIVTFIALGHACTANAQFYGYMPAPTAQVAYPYASAPVMGYVPGQMTYVPEAYDAQFANLPMQQPEIHEKLDKAGDVQPSGCHDCGSVFPLVATVELTLLAPHHSMGIRGVNGTDLSFGLRAAPRVSLAYNWPSGFGTCVR